MSDNKNNNKGSVLLQLYNNKLLSTKIHSEFDKADAGGDSMTYDEMVELCNEYDLQISKPSLSRYRARRVESIEEGIPLVELLDQRKKSGNIIDIRTPDDEGAEPETLSGSSFDETFKTVDKVYSDIQVLDEIIQKGWNALQYTETADIPHALRAIEIRAKLTDNSMQGLSLVGLRELRMRSQAKHSAMLDSIMMYVPEDQHEELLDYIDEQEKAFYDNLDLNEEDRKLTDALDLAGIDF